MNVLLELLIGLALLYLLTSVVASFIVEAVASYLKLRATGLESCIAQLVEGAANRGLAVHGGGATWTSRFYAHPLIRALSTARVMTADRSSRPSYIPREQYASVLLDMVRQAAKLAPGEPLSAARLREIVADASVTLPSGLRSMIETALSNGLDTLDKVRASMEAGFDATMERASGWYKRRTQLWLMLFAFVLAGAFNLDSFYIGSRLLKDETLRATAMQIGVNAVSGERAQSPERFAAVVGMWATRLQGATSAVLALRDTADAEARNAGLRALHDANHFNAMDAEAAWNLLTAATPEALGAALTAAVPKLADKPGGACAEGSPQPAADTSATLDMWLQHLRCLPKDAPQLAAAIENFRKSALLWSQPDRVIDPALGRLLVPAVTSAPGEMELRDLKNYLVALNAAAGELKGGIDTALSRLPEVGLISDVSKGWDHGRWWRAFFGWLATAIMAGLGAPFWFDLLGKFVSLRGAGRKPAAGATAPAASAGP